MLTIVLDLKVGTRTVYSCKTSEKTNEKQKGGNYIVPMEKYGQYSKMVGKDETYLGRWSWLRIEDNNEIKNHSYYSCSPYKPTETIHMHKNGIGISKVFVDAPKKQSERTYFIKLHKH